MLIPSPTKVVQFTVPIAQFFRQLAVVVPSAAEAMQLVVSLPVFHADLAIAIIKPICATF
jgi:hypothetical protein